MTTRECAICGNSLPDGRRKYCSEPCAREGCSRNNRTYKGHNERKALAQKDCVICGTRFNPLNRTQVTCGSAECKAERNLAAKRDVRTPMTCDVCGNTFTPSRKDQLRCSTVCKQRAVSLNRHYGLSVSDFIQMFKNQNGRCAICDERIDVIGGYTTSIACVDHDHDTGAIRGLLCKHCNCVLGHARDDVQVLMSAAAYLVTRTPEWLESHRAARRGTR